MGRKKAAKKWFDVYAPQSFDGAKIGEVLSGSPEDLINRTVEVTLGELTNDPSRQNVKLIFQITNVDGDRASARFIGHQVSRDYMRSLVKKNSSKVEVIEDVTTRDGTKFRVKACCFTLKKANTPQESAIRKTASEILRKRAEELDADQYVKQVVWGILALDIYREAKKVYPLRRVEIEKTKLL